MKKTILLILVIAATFCFGFYSKSIITNQSDGSTGIIQTNNNSNIKGERNMKLGAFSVSLSVKDLNVSKEFYEDLGFTLFAGGMEKNYLIMKNGMHSSDFSGECSQVIS